jgi:ketosteroid isomerase-like protein
MSEQNVEVVRGLFDAVSRGDYDAAARFLHADAEWHNTAVFPGPRTVHGPEAITQFWKDMFRSYGGGGSSRMQIERVTEVNDVVVIAVHGWWSGSEGGVPLETRWAQTVRVRDGKALRGEAHGSYRKALEAVGLRE